MLLRSGRDMEFFLNNGESDYLLVAFGEIAFLADGRNYWARPMIERRNINAIGIAARTPNWFPHADLEEFVAEHRDLLDRFAGRIVLVGHSMGGYGAIKYSGLFGATTVVTTAPQYSLDRSILPNDKRPPIPYFRPELHTGIEPRPEELSGEIYIFYDLYHSSHPQADAFAAMNLPRIHIFNTPSIGHEVMNIFASNDGLVELVDLCRKGDADEIGRFVHERRRALPLRIATLALRAAARRPDLAIRIYEANKRRFPPMFIAFLSERLRTTRPGAAEKLLRDALARDPRLADRHPAVSRLLALRGRPAEAQALVTTLPPI